MELEHWHRYRNGAYVYRAYSIRQLAIAEGKDPDAWIERERARGLPARDLVMIAGSSEALWHLPVIEVGAFVTFEGVRYRVVQRVGSPELDLVPATASDDGGRKRKRRNL